MCGCKVAPTAKVGNPGFLKSLALLDKSRLTEIARVIVCDRKPRKMLLQQWNHARVRKECVRLFLGNTLFCDNAFEITDRHICRFEYLSKRLKRIFSLLDLNPGFFVFRDHDVPHHDQLDLSRFIDRGRICSASWANGCEAKISDLETDQGTMTRHSGFQRKNDTISKAICEYSSELVSNDVQSFKRMLKIVL